MKKALAASFSYRYSEVLGGNLNTDDMIRTTTHAEAQVHQYQISVQLFFLPPSFRNNYDLKNAMLLCLLCYVASICLSIFNSCSPMSGAKIRIILDITQ